MNRLRDKITVEPIASTQLAKVETRVLAAFEGLEPHTRRAFGKRATTRWAVPVVVAAAAGLLGYLVGSDRGSTPTASESTVVSTDASGSSTLRVGDARITVGPSTDATIERTADRGVVVSLATGQIDCSVAPRENRPPFVVLAGDVAVSVVGTQFSVRKGDEVHVEVTRGKVAVESAGRLTMVSAGHRWATGDRRVVALKSSRLSPSHSTVGGAAVDPDSTPDATAASTDAPRVSVREREAKRPGLGRRSAKVPKTGDSPAKDSAVGVPARLLRRARPARRRVPSADTGNVLSQVREQEREDPRGAVKHYLRIARASRGARAEYALYSAAYVQHVRLGDRAGALSTLRFLESRFPSGRHRHDVMWLHVRVRCDSGASRSCRIAAHAYLNRHSSGRFNELARRIINAEL